MVEAMAKRVSRPIMEFAPSDGVLGITLGAGGGHLTTMGAVGSEFRQQRPHSYYKAIDVIRGSFPSPLSQCMGYLSSNGWNQAKKEGDIQKQENLLKGKIFWVTKQRLADVIFFIPVFLATFFRLLCNRRITHITDTQPIATGAILAAARLINFLLRRKIRVTKIMTDLPTLEAIHYSACSRRMSAADKKIYQLVTTEPFKPHTRETPEEYLARQESWWNEHYGLSLENGGVRYADFPVRPSFKAWAGKSKEERTHKLGIKVNHRDEFEMIRSLLRGKCEWNPQPRDGEPAKKKSVMVLDVGEKAVMGMITLGSQAAKKTINYVDNFVEVVKRRGDSKKNYYLFVACGAYVPGNPSLFKDVYEMCRNIQLPKHVVVIPLGFQDDDEFAPMMHRADFGIYGSGGVTCMEVNTVATGRILVHSEKNITQEMLKKESPQQVKKRLLEGFALWEKGNALFQEETRGARIVAPGQLFADVLLGEKII